MDAGTIEKLKRALEAKRELLRNEVEDKKSFPEFSTTDAGQVDEEAEADEVEEYANALAVGSVLKKDLEAVDKALERITQGVYGKCLACGNEIAPERLNAFPETETCGCT